MKHGRIKIKKPKDLAKVIAERCDYEVYLHDTGRVLVLVNKLNSNTHERIRHLFGASGYGVSVDLIESPHQITVFRKKFIFSKTFEVEVFEKVSCDAKKRLKDPFYRKVVA